MTPTLAEDIEIDSDAILNASARGWPVGQGPGPGIAEVGGSGGSGASHGGTGGRGTSVSYSNPAC